MARVFALASVLGLVITLIFSRSRLRKSGILPVYVKCVCLIGTLLSSDEGRAGGVLRCREAITSVLFDSFEDIRESEKYLYSYGR